LLTPPTSWLSKSVIVWLNYPSRFLILVVCMGSPARLRTLRGPGYGFYLLSSSWLDTRAGARSSPTTVCGASHGERPPALRDSSWICFLWNGSAKAGPFAAGLAARINPCRAPPLVASCGRRWQSPTLGPCVMRWRVVLKRRTPLCVHVLWVACWLASPVCHASHPPTLR
jgi:hypothetical protein